MKSETQEEIYESVYESTIVKYDFDLYKKQICFNLMRCDNDEQHAEHNVVFRNVSAFNYINNSGELSELIIEEWNPNDDILEFTSISFLDKSTSSFQDDGSEWLSQYKPCYNIAIEIGNSILLINSTNIIIDGQDYIINE